MPSAKVDAGPTLPHWDRPGKTEFGLPWADVEIIDLAAQLRDAAGFFSVINTGLAQEEVDRQYDIAQAFFELSLEEKDKAGHRCDFAAGNYFGYRRAHEKHIMGTDSLNIEESFNIPKSIPNNAALHGRPPPLALRRHKGAEHVVEGTHRLRLVHPPVRGLDYVRECVKSYHDHTNYADRKGQTFKVGDLEIDDEAA